MIARMEESTPKTILNIGSGKIDVDAYLKNTGDFRIHVDRSYDVHDMMDDAENAFFKFKENPKQVMKNNWFLDMDIFEFMDAFKYKFDYVVAWRIFEHLEYTSGQIGRLLEACNVLTTDNGVLDIVVPNGITLSKKLLEIDEHISKYDIQDKKFLNDVLIINTEFTNCSHVDPHCSVWTPSLARFYIEPEGTWEVKSIIDPVDVCGRDIYMRLIVTKPGFTNPIQKEESK